MRIEPPTVDHPWGVPDLGLALAKTYAMFRDAGDQCPTGPVIRARDNLAEALCSFGLRPSEADEIIKRHEYENQTDQ